MIGSVVVVIGALSAQPPPPQPQDPAVADQEGVEVLARGPVHEAFAQPGVQKQEPSPIIPKKPPEPIQELPPEEKPEGDQVQWIPGYWGWDDDRNDFLWVSGIWRAPPPSHQWVPGYWEQADKGWRWVSGYWGLSGESDTVDLYPPPPEPVQEAIPPAPNEDSSYIPGCWMYVDDQFLWRPGYWVPHQPGWIWTPACYNWTPAGYAFVNGYWDHDFDHRGVCFAPVAIAPPFLNRQGFHYRPHYALATDFLRHSLFVHPARHHYFVGDYYDAAHARRGYVPWVNYRNANKVPDHLFSYQRWQNRATPGWEKEMHKQYQARQDGTLARPPRTLVEQRKQVVSNKVNITNVTNVKQWKGSALKLGAMPKAHHDEVQKSTQQWRNFSQQRSKIESQARAKVARPAPAQQPIIQRPTQINLPRPAIRAPTSVRKPPTHPAPPPPKAPHKGKK